METLFVQSPANQRIKALSKLWQRKRREETERFLIEGLRELSHAVRGGVEVDTLYFCPECFKSSEHEEFVSLAGEQEDVSLVKLSPEAFSKLSYREGPDGLIGEADLYGFDLDEIEPPPNPLFMIVDGVEKPGNLGAILRSADAAGVDALFCSDLRTDIFNPNVIRSSQGLVFAVPVFIADPEEILRFMHSCGVIVHATTPDGTKTLWDIDFSGPSAIAVGAEATGLSTYWLEHADSRTSIPMHGNADSLNVNAASVVTLFEAARQRRVSTISD